jgi:hypothetical protein
MKPEIVSEIESIIKKLLINHHERLKLTHLLSSELSTLLQNCKINNITNVVISTQKTLYC